MARRRRNSIAVSLFAFQDVMASVIGVLFVVVLLMSLDMVEKAAAAPTTEEAAARIEALRAEEQALREEIAAASAGLAEQTVTSLKVSTSDDQALLDQVLTLERTLRSMHERIEAMRAEVAVQQAKSQRLGEQQSALAERLSLAEADEAALNGKLAGAGTAPRVAFIVDERPDHLSPWLAEVSKEGIRVALAKDPTSVMEFAGSDGGEAGFAKWARQQDKKSYYFVILVKPSGNKLADSLEPRLEQMGFELGRDLVPEDWQSF